jgi:amidophosphoribosyltransferase
MSGLFGVVEKESCLETLFYGTDYHSHLGTQFGGVAVWDGELHRKIHNINTSQFKSKFHEDHSDLSGNKGIGVISAVQEQPICLNSRFGPFAIVTDGWIDNAETLAQELLENGESFSEFRKGTINQTELVSKLINQGKDILDGIQNVFKRIEGSCTMLILTEEGLYAARDRLGYFPLTVGFNEKGCAVATETGALTNLEYKIEKYLGPGEVVLISENGLECKRPAGNKCQTCAFLWIYTGFPSSNYEGINAEVVRERCGQYLAKRDVVKPDVVGGVPDSGTAHAVGYSIESKIPCRRPLVKYTPGYGRSYTPPTQEERDQVAKMKLIAIQELVDGKSVLICEDSIVRGTQLKNFTIKKLWESNAKEIHVRPACPPLMFPCKFNVSTRSIDELIARRAIRSIEGRDIEDISEYLDANSEKYQNMIDWINEYIGTTTLRYQTIDDMVQAIGLPREKLCLYCWTGEEDS